MRCCLLVLLTLSISQAQQNTTTAGRQQDLDYIANTLTKIDVNFYAQLDPAAFQTAVAALQSRLTTATDAEFYVGLAQLVAMSGDMHTNLSLIGAFKLSALPIAFRWLEEGLFVSAAPPAYSMSIGAQVVAVNGMPIGQVVQLLGTTYAHANDQELHYVAATSLTSLVTLRGLDIIPANATVVPMTFQTLAGDQFSLNIDLNVLNSSLVSGIPGPVPDYLQNPNSYYWFSYYAAIRMLYAKYNICEDDPNGINVATYSAQILAALDSNPVDTVVIDFRANGGGNEYLLFPLGVGLFSRLATLRTNPNFRIYLVIDKGSFSSGMYTPMAFKSGYLAFWEHIPIPDTTGIMYVIGEPTSGKPIGFGDVLNFNLPYSKLYGYYSTTALINQDGGVIPDLPSFYPDIEVPTRAADYFAGHDPVMAAMLARYTGTTPTNGPSIILASTDRTQPGAIGNQDASINSPSNPAVTGSIISIYATGDAAPSSVYIGGNPAQVQYSGPVTWASGLWQINAQIPPSTPAGLNPVFVVSGNTPSNGVTVAVRNP